MKAIEQIIAGYVSLGDRRALEQIRDHRRRLLQETLMRSGSGFHPSTVIDTLQEEVDLIEAALARYEIASEDEIASEETP
ncbi:hypothetical protein JQ633_28960 [Bradyrhizobium tropiciagri]|uniref:hypothetical protein n=1 Tax=Bradyrhizobium tropiciagri TaxID=312253 RepID=UPI001BAB7B64|nr:hypothetical protein [Bradyrhizobium tropiciagri]MBR0874417.1 hypothetical protein [Bradyrhizobium tropiciagri]